MIYCFEFDEVEGYLRTLGWRCVGRTELHGIYGRGEDYITFPRPNVDGKIPETLVNEALDELEIPVPKFEPSWCD